MKTKSTHPLYLVYFPYKSITLRELSKIKYISNVVVNWRPYINSRNVPIQCDRCQQYGHGQKNCFQPIKCHKCSESHQSSKCMNDLQKQSGNQFIPKCCLCNKSHSARDPDCPKRLEYSNMKLSQNNSSRRHVNHSKQKKTPTFQINSNDFPSFKVNPNQKYSSWFKAEASNINIPNQQHCIEGNIENLFSAAELIAVAKELMILLKNCKTKYEQIECIATIAIKYTSNNNV